MQVCLCLTKGYREVFFWVVRKVLRGKICQTKGSNASRPSLISTGRNYVGRSRGDAPDGSPLFVEAGDIEGEITHQLSLTGTSLPR